MNEWFFGGMYGFVIACGFIRGEMSVMVGVLIIKVLKCISRLGVAVLIGYLLYLGHYVDLPEWKLTYLHEYNNGIKVVMLMLLWLCFPITQLATMNISLSCSLFEGPRKTRGRMGLHLLTVLVSFGVVFTSQQFLASVVEKIISSTLPTEKLTLIPTYALEPVSVQYLIPTVTGFVLYMVLGLLSQR